MGSFGDATAVEAIDDHTWSATIAEGWDIMGNANGGYLLALAARALAGATGRPDPLTVTAHFLSPGHSGPVTVATEVVGRSRRFATARGLLHSEVGDILHLTGTFGDLETLDGPVLIDGAPPELPAPDDCIALRPGEGFPPPFVAQVDVRLHPDDAGFALGDPSGVARIRGWFGLRGNEPLDPFALLLGADAFPPTIFNTELPVAWVPTLELTTHVRRRPAPGWLRASFTTRFVTGGFLEVDSELWDAADRLVAQARQLALVPRG